METVQILLSSYNGEKYIREQIDSILNQKGVDVTLVIRDDGSTDGTRDILKEYERKYSNVSVICGRNVGVINSFFKLIQIADEKINYFAFSDQDDVWLSDKLNRALKKIKKNNQEKGPIVYCSSRRLVDRDLNPLKSAIKYRNVRTEFGNALVENMCTGCTCVINRDMLAKLKGRQPDFCVMHDFWIYLVGTCFGRVIYDSGSRILYRQHGNNELGSASTMVDNYCRRIKNYKKHRGQLSKQMTSFLSVYGSTIPNDKRKLVDLLQKNKSIKENLRFLLFEKRIFRQRKTDNLILKILICLGKI